MLLRLIFAGTAAALFVAALGGADEPGGSAKPSDERVKLVRAMYEKLPIDILGITEPVKKLEASGLFDGGTIRVTVHDAKDQQLVFQLDRKINTTTRDDLFLTGKTGGHLPHRSPEEAAIYGLIVRCMSKPPDGTAKNDLKLAGDVLTVLDGRFAGAVPESK